MLRWPAVERVWLPEWLADPEAVLDRLVARLAEPVPSEPVESEPLESEPWNRHQWNRNGPTGSRRPTRLTHPAQHLSSRVLRCPSRPGPSIAMPGETAFVAWHPAPAGDRSVLDRLSGQDGRRRVWQQLVAGIEAEAPIHYDRLARITAAAFGLTRVSPERRAAILGCLPPGLPRDPVGEEFAWPYGVDPLTWNGFRRSTTDERAFDQISVVEIGNAMVALCRAAAGMTTTQLQLETLRVFGFTRRTPERDARTLLCLDHAAGVGHLQRGADGLVHAL